MRGGKPCRVYTPYIDIMTLHTFIPFHTIQYLWTRPAGQQRPLETIFYDNSPALTVEQNHSPMKCTVLLELAFVIFLSKISFHYSICLLALASQHIVTLNLITPWDFIV